METAGIPGGLRPYRNWRMKKARPGCSEVCYGAARAIRTVCAGRGEPTNDAGRRSERRCRGERRWLPQAAKGDALHKACHSLCVLEEDQLSASLICTSFGAFSPKRNAWPTRRNRFKLYDARSMTSSQIKINTPIVIAATAAARLSSARAALEQSDCSATSSHGSRHRSTRTASSLSSRNGSNLANFNGRNCDG